MADIPVQPRRATPWWLWLLGLLIVLVILWFVYDLFTGSGDDLREPDETGVVGEAARPLLAPTAAPFPLYT